MSVDLADIQSAARRIAPAIYRSPNPYSLSLSRLCGCEIYCKLDHLQMTGSFKERGARNKLELLGDTARRAGVVAASAGNHALGLSYHGQLLGVPVTVVMPRWAPLVKVSNCRSFQAEVILHGESLDEARLRAMQLAQERHLTFIHPFDDADVIAGQGTIGLEILQDVPDVDAIIVPIGGGGLISGIATAVKATHRQVRVIGVEPAHAPTVHTSLQRGSPTRIVPRTTLADGLAVAQVGSICFPIIQKWVDEVILIDEARIAQAVLRLLEMEKMVLEGAGAISLAAALNARAMGLEGKKVVLVLCGGNIDMNVLGRIIERGLASDGRLCRIVTLLDDRPGFLAQLLGIIARSGGSIKEVSHDRNFGPADIAKVAVACLIETRDAQHVAEIRSAISAAGLEVL